MRRNSDTPFEKMKTTLVCLLALLTLAHSGLAQLTYWPASAGGNGHFYEAFVAPSGVSWSNAQDVAVAMGGHLATITSQAENDFVYGLVSDSPALWVRQGSWGWGPWLGGHQAAGSAEPDGGWYWVTGEPFVYTNWGASLNNYGGDEDSIQFYGQGTPTGALWNDLSSTNTQFVCGYIVEFESHPRWEVSIHRKNQSQVELRWPSATNAQYQVQCVRDLGTTNWDNVGGPVDGNGWTNIVSDVTSEQRRFYRLLQIQ
jgi:hypothetical protein